MKREMEEYDGLHSGVSASTDAVRFQEMSITTFSGNSAEFQWRSSRFLA